jgi:hypothetical protein
LYDTKIAILSRPATESDPATSTQQKDCEVLALAINVPPHFSLNNPEIRAVDSFSLKEKTNVKTSETFHERLRASAGIRISDSANSDIAPKLEGRSKRPSYKAGAKRRRVNR